MIGGTPSPAEGLDKLRVVLHGRIEPGQLCGLGIEVNPLHAGLERRRCEP